MHNRCKIIPRIVGGIGNQLFIYAAARRLAFVNGAELVLDTVSGFSRDHAYQRCYQLKHFSIPCRMATATERMEPFARLRRYLKRQINYKLPYGQRNYLVQESMDFDSRLLAIKPSGTLHMAGYWQSEDYFKDIEGRIREDLLIKPPTDRVNQELRKRIRCENAIAVHYRFFDTPVSAKVESTPNNISYDYYLRAISEMEMRFKDAHFFIFSDQPETAKAKVHLPRDRYTMVTHNKGDAMAFADLWLMSQCRHFIIANSTFSWWGAWLGEREGTHIIAPGFEKRSGLSWWGFKGLLPERWIKL